MGTRHVGYTVKLEVFPSIEELYPCDFRWNICHVPSSKYVSIYLHYKVLKMKLLRMLYKTRQGVHLYYMVKMEMFSSIKALRASGFRIQIECICMRGTLKVYKRLCPQNTYKMYFYEASYTKLTCLQNFYTRQAKQEFHCWLHNRDEKVLHLSNTTGLCSHMDCLMA